MQTVVPKFNTQRLFRLRQPSQGRSLRLRVFVIGMVLSELLPEVLVVISFVEPAAFVELIDWPRFCGSVVLLVGSPFESDGAWPCPVFPLLAVGALGTSTALLYSPASLDNGCELTLVLSVVLFISE